MSDAVLTDQRILSVLEVLRSRPEQDGHHIVSFQSGQPTASWVGCWPDRRTALENGYRILGCASEFWVQDIAETRAWGPSAVAGEVEYQSWTTKEQKA